MNTSNQKDFSRFFETMLKMRKILDQTLDGQDDNALTMLQLLTLKTILENPMISASDLAIKLDMSSSAITQMTDRLMKMQFITREFDEEDRRLVLLSLTTQGEQHVHQILKKMEQKANEILAPISAQDLQTVVRIFNNFLHHYEK